MYTDIQNGIDIIEKLANGERGGAPAYWEDAEEFFRSGEWDMLQDLELPPPPEAFGSFDPFQ